MNIGFEGTKLVSAASKWNVYHEGHKTAFYTIVNSKTYILWPDNFYEQDGTYGAKLIQTNDLSVTPTVLIRQDESVTYTCYPEIGFGVETIRDERLEISGEWYVPLGNYRLVIKDGKKQLEVW